MPAEKFPRQATRLKLTATGLQFWKRTRPKCFASGCANKTQRFPLSPKPRPGPNSLSPPRLLFHILLNQFRPRPLLQRTSPLNLQDDVWPALLGLVLCPGLQVVSANRVRGRVVDFLANQGPL